MLRSAKYVIAAFLCNAPLPLHQLTSPHRPNQDDGFKVPDCSTNKEVRDGSAVVGD